MWELRFEDYINNRKYSSATTNSWASSLFGASTTNRTLIILEKTFSRLYFCFTTENVFLPNTISTSSILGLPLFENKSVVSRVPTVVQITKRSSEK